MKCLRDVAWVKAEWRSSVKNHFHGLRGLGHFPNKLKMHFVRTNALLAN